MKPLATALAICLLIALSATARAQTRNWDGASAAPNTNDWSTGSNWDTRPTSGEDVVLDGAVDTGDDICIYNDNANTANPPYGALTITGMTLQVDKPGGLEFEELATVSGSWDLTGAEPLYLRYVSVTADATIDNQSTAALYADRVSVDATSGSITLTLDNDANDSFYYLKEVVLTADGANEAVLVVTSDTPNVYIEVLDIAGSNDANSDELQFNENVTMTSGTIFRSGTTEVNVAAGKIVDGGRVTMNAGTYEKKGTGLFISS